MDERPPRLLTMRVVVTTAVLRDVRTELGLAEGDPPAAYFTLTPPALEHPAAPAPAHAQHFRALEAPAPAALPDWWDGARGPLVYVTLGSVAPRMEFFPDLYRAAIGALAALPVRILVTIGRDRDPADLGPVPPNVRVERWVAQADVLPHAAAMLCHGGSGPTYAERAAALAAEIRALPSVEEAVDVLGDLAAVAR